MKNPTSKRTVLPGRFPKMKTFSDERGVSPVIAVILMVAITVVLASVLYVMVINIFEEPDPPEFGRLQYEKDYDESGKYILTYDGSRDLEDIEISVFDDDTNRFLVLDPETETYKEIPGGINLTYLDINQNEQLDGVDRLILHGGEEGDSISVADKNGRNVVECTLE